jgi:hypothetical protein
VTEAALITLGIKGLELASAAFAAHERRKAAIAAKDREDLIQAEDVFFQKCLAIHKELQIKLREAEKQT